MATTRPNSNATSYKSFSIYSIPHEGSIVLTCPIAELKDYLTRLRVPSIYFIIRLVKSCVMAVFRGHFYDIDHVLVATKTGQYMHTFDGSLISQTPKQFREEHPFMLEHALLFSAQEEESSDEGSHKPKKLITEDKIDFSMFQSNFRTSLSLAHVVTYYRDTLKIEGFPSSEKSKGAFADLRNHPYYNAGYFIKIKKA